MNQKLPFSVEKFQNILMLTPTCGLMLPIKKNFAPVIQKKF